MCPHCGREAPLVYRGAVAFCSACNVPRVPLSAAGVNLAGKPAKIGGTVASVAGWVVLAVTLGIALILGALLQAIFPPGAVVGWAVGGVLAAIGVAAALVLLLGGRFLLRTGDQAAVTARRDAVLALAKNQGGILRAPIVARSIGVSAAEAEAFLTSMSRDPESGCTLEVDGEGKLYYRFAGIAPEQWPPLGALGTPVVITPPAAKEPPVRVAVRTEIPDRGRDDARLEDEPVDDEMAEPGAKRANRAP